MKVDTIDLNGKKNSIEVSDKLFDGKVNKKLVDIVLYKTLYYYIVFNYIINNFIHTILTIRR